FLLFTSDRDTPQGRSLFGLLAELPIPAGQERQPRLVRATLAMPWITNAALQDAVRDRFSDWGPHALERVATWLRMECGRLDPWTIPLNELLCALQDARDAERGPRWTPVDFLSRWARIFGVSARTLKRRLDDGTIRHLKHSSKLYQIAVEELP